MSFLENIPTVLKKTDNALCETGELRAMTVELGQEELYPQRFQEFRRQKKEQKRLQVECTAKEPTK